MGKKQGPVVCFCGLSMVLREGQWGPWWSCPGYPRCDGAVGCHKGSTRPKGTPANGVTRKARKGAHEVFDPVWKKVADEVMEMDGAQEAFGFPGMDSEDAEEAYPVVRQYSQMARRAAYRWLSGRMGIEPKECHIAMMDDVQCDRIIEFLSSRRLAEIAVGEICDVVEEMRSEGEE